MPRERFDDATTPGRYAQVNWRKPDDDGTGNPGYVQVSAHDETGRATTSDLIMWAAAIITDVAVHAVGCPSGSDESLKAARGWLDYLGAHRSELDSNYTQLDETRTAELIRTLHKAKRQAFGEQPVTADEVARHWAIRGHDMRDVSTIEGPPQVRCVVPDHAGQPCWVVGDTSYPAPPPALDGVDTGSRRYASGGVIRPHADNNDSIPAFLSGGSGPYSRDPYTGRPAPTMPTHGYHLQREADEQADPESSTT